ncbi:MAG TPA: ATP-binding SpoIIE family protein phosphatase [Longimicrobiaceae bacterium]|nr:ATP-binding SpoIIE family protein phosphatase [Longimicrobiaceae bacterium]
MESRCGVVLSVEEMSEAGEARRRVARMAHELGFDETDAGRVALVATEMAGNLAKHTGGRGGRMLAQPRLRGGVAGVELLALDTGPGISDLGEALRDGYSTAGSPGTGLGAISRVADEWDIHSQPGAGTAVLARLWPRSTPAPPAAAVEVGSVMRPMPGEDVCGDGWAVRAHPGGVQLLVVDGLGHGPGAAEASGEAMRAFHAHPGLAPAEMLRRLHDALRGTRGAAAAVADLDAERGEVRFAGVGNIAGAAIGHEEERSMVSMSGIVGHHFRRAQEFSYPWPPGALVILHSDGLGSRWSLGGYPGLLARDPSLVAGVLFRDLARDSDDATVVVARRGGRA